MADKDSAPRSPAKDFGWFIIFLIVLGVIWFAQGGPSRLSSMTSPFIQSPNIPAGGSPSQQGSGSTVSSTGAPAAEYSSYKGKIFLSANGARETDPRREYLEIRNSYSNTGAVLISDWTLKGRGGFAAAIGQGANLVFSAQVNPQEPIYLKPNDTAIVTTGQSPIGTNLRLNICTGYFNQFQNFIPYLPEECPRISEKEMPISFPKACVDFVNSLPYCRMPIGIPYEIQIAIGADCVNFINQKVGYNSCVDGHKNDSNFYKNEWRIYLGREKELWGERDDIILYDRDGKIVDQVSY